MNVAVLLYPNPYRMACLSVCLSTFGGQATRQDRHEIWEGREKKVLSLKLRGKMMNPSPDTGNGGKKPMKHEMIYDGGR